MKSRNSRIKTKSEYDPSAQYTKDYKATGTVIGTVHLDERLSCYCDICGKVRNGKIKHTKCSKIRQELYSKA